MAGGRLSLIGVVMLILVHREGSMIGKTHRLQTAVQKCKSHDGGVVAVLGFIGYQRILVARHGPESTAFSVCRSIPLALIRNKVWRKSAL